MGRAAIVIALACLAGCGGAGESGGVWISPRIGCADSESGSGYSVGRFDLLLAEASGVYDAAVIDGGEGEDGGRRKTVIVRSPLYGAELPDGEAVLELDDVDGAMPEERCPALVVMSGAGGFSRTVLRHYGIYQDNIFSDTDEPAPHIETLIFCYGRPSLSISSANDKESQAETPIFFSGRFYIAESGELLWGTNDYHGIKVFRRHALARAKAGKRGPKPGAFAASYTLGMETGEVTAIVAATRDTLLIVGTAGLGRCSYDGNGGMEQSFTGIRWDERPIEVVAMYAGKGAAPGVAAVFKNRLIIWDSWAAGAEAEVAKPTVLPLGKEACGLSVIRNGVQPELLISTSGFPLRAFRDGQSGSWSVEPLVHITASDWRTPWNAEERAAALAESYGDLSLTTVALPDVLQRHAELGLRAGYVGDFDRDGLKDMFLITRSGQVIVLLDARNNFGDAGK